MPTLLQVAEGNIAGGDMREPLADPARSKNLCMYGTSMHENREIPALVSCQVTVPEAGGAGTIAQTTRRTARAVVPPVTW